MSTLSRKFTSKRMNATKEGIEFLLSIEEVESLLNEAGIDVSQWNLRGYHLARYGDSGPYVIGNCRFIPAIENYRERKSSELMLQSASRNIAKHMNERSPEERKRISRLARSKVKDTGASGRSQAAKLTPEERKEKARKAGIASGIKRRGGV